MKVASRNIYADVPIAGTTIMRQTLVAVRGQAVPNEYRHLVDPADLVDEATLAPQPLSGPLASATTVTHTEPDPTAGATDDLTKAKREVLDARAAKAGVEEPEKLPNKSAVIAALADKVAGEDLGDLDRDALNTRATALGVDEPEKLGTKDDVIVAIAARSQP